MIDFYFDPVSFATGGLEEMECSCKTLDVIVVKECCVTDMSILVWMQSS